ncbi:MAG: tRNA pseudouridine(55) synthase TruB [Sphingobacteriales bacterium]|jgi:tRNA pseudouridine55 synthase
MTKELMAWQEEFAQGKMLLIDKPLKWTSFDAVKKVRILTKISKVGHAGTLDPLATGLLIICTGKFTKQINTYMAQEKEYTGSFTLGAITPTYDLESAPEDVKEYAHLTEEEIRKATEQFIGEIEQIPPAHSAIKKDGIPVYKLARKGKEVKLDPRKVTISIFEITNIVGPVVNFRVVCSTGTYIRSLANDFGKVLGCGAYLSSLRRTKIGEFNVESAQSIEEFDSYIQQLKGS